MIGTLMMLDTGRWGIASKDREQPYEITSGEVFAVEIEGTMRITRMEFVHGGNGGGRYEPVDDLRLFEGMRAANGKDMEVERETTADEQSGMDWWNGLDERQRRDCLIALEADGKQPTVAAAWAAQKAKWR